MADLVGTLRGNVTSDNGLSLCRRAGRAGRRAHHVQHAACSTLLDGWWRCRCLSPLAVAPQYQKQGIGSALVREGLKIMRGRQVPLSFLEGDLAYYCRLGFLPGGDQGFRKPSLRIPDAAFQVLRLPRYEPWTTGTWSTQSRSGATTQTAYVTIRWLTLLLDSETVELFA